MNIYTYRFFGMLITFVDLLATGFSLAGLFMEKKRDGEVPNKLIKTFYIIVIICTAGVAFIGTQMMSYVEVPDVRNLSYSSACTLLTNNNISYKPNNEYLFGNYVVVSQGGTEGALYNTNGKDEILLECELVEINDKYEIVNLGDNCLEIDSGELMEVELSIVTPDEKIEKTTPYILYSGYYNQEVGEWIQFGSKYIEAGETGYLLEINTEKLGISSGTYIFEFCIFDAGDYSQGKSKVVCDLQVSVIGDAKYIVKDNYLEGVVEYKKIEDIFVINGKAYKYDVTELEILDDVTNSDIEKIANCTKLKSLQICGKSITNLAPLAKLTSLEKLIISSEELTDISPISSLTNLKVLSVGGTEINGMGHSGSLYDITPLENLTNIEVLTISDCLVDDIQVVSNFYKLRSLWVYKTEVYDISPISNLILLETLTIHNNKIVDITSLYNLKELETLTLSHNPIPEEQINMLQKLHPNCTIINSYYE